MKLYGKTLSQYVAFIKGPLIFLLIVFVVRWIVSELGAPPSLEKYLSLSVLSIPIVVYLPLKVHTRQFGGYPQLGVLYLLIATWINLIVVGGILVAAATGRPNVYSLADLGSSSTHFKHIVAHLTVAIGVVTLINFGIGSLILYLLRRCDTPPKPLPKRP